MKLFYTKSTFIVFLFFLFSTPQVFSQNNENESLLWEISGNGLLYSSYIYGTIHIQDKRVFNLNDSLIIAIENCEVFANELNFDSLSTIAFKSILQFSNSENNIHNLLTDDEYQKLNDRAIELLGISLDNMAIKDPVIIAFAFESLSIKKDMPYSLDEFLYRIAKSKGKTIHSVENAEDQLNALSKIDSETIKSILKGIVNNQEKNDLEIEKLIENYFNNNLNALVKYFTNCNKEYPQLADAFLYDRNFKMKNRIEKLITNNSSVVAVGAAHLFGEKGLVNLFRKAGYSVRPIIKTNSGLVNKYFDNEIEIPWEKFIPPSGGFEIEMPGIASPMQLPNLNLNVESGFVLDIGNQIIYVALKIILSDLVTDEKADSVVNSFLKKIQSSEFIVNDKIVVNGINGKKIEGESDVQQISAEVFARKNNLYLFFVFYPKGKTYNKEIERYFNSLKILNQ